MFFDRWYIAQMEQLRPKMKALFPYWDPTGGRMPTFRWGDRERARHQHLLSRFNVVLDASHCEMFSQLNGARLPVPLPRTFNDPRAEAGTIEVTTYRQYFSLVFDAYPQLMREMQILHGETPSG